MQYPASFGRTKFTVDAPARTRHKEFMKIACLFLIYAALPIAAQPDAPAQSSNVRPLPSESASLVVSELNAGKLNGHLTNDASMNYQSADIHATDIHASDIHAVEIRPANIQAADVHAPDVHITQDIHAPDIHAADIHIESDTNSVPNIQSGDLRK